MLNINFVFMPIHLFSDMQFSILSTLASTVASKLGRAWPARLAKYQLGILLTTYECLSPSWKPTCMVEIIEKLLDQIATDLSIDNNEHQNLLDRIKGLYQARPRVMHPGL